MKVLHQHPLILWINLIPGVALLLITLVATYLYPHLHISSEVPPMVWPFLKLALLLVSFLVLYVGWYTYSRTEVVITPEHLFDINQVTLFNKRTAQLELHRVQDVTVAKKGILPTMFNFGDVVIQTAGTQDFFVLHKMPDPDLVCEELTGLFPDIIPPHSP